jgi:hypothetical protein
MTRFEHLVPLRSVPFVAVALAAVLVTMWLAGTGLQSNGLYADRPAAVASR